MMLQSVPEVVNHVYRLSRRSPLHCLIGYISEQGRRKWDKKQRFRMSLFISRIAEAITVHLDYDTPVPK